MARTRKPYHIPQSRYRDGAAWMRSVPGQWHELVVDYPGTIDLNERDRLLTARAASIRNVGIKAMGRGEFEAMVHSGRLLVRYPEGQAAEPYLGGNQPPDGIIPVLPLTDDADEDEEDIEYEEEDEEETSATEGCLPVLDDTLELTEAVELLGLSWAGILGAIKSGRLSCRVSLTDLDSYPLHTTNGHHP